MLSGPKQRRTAVHTRVEHATADTRPRRTPETAESDPLIAAAFQTYSLSRSSIPVRIRPLLKLCVTT
jgi:hypothetical protein